MFLHVMRNNVSEWFLMIQEMASAATDLNKRMAMLEEQQQMHAVVSKVQAIEQEMIQQCNSTMVPTKFIHTEYLCSTRRRSKGIVSETKRL